MPELRPDPRGPWDVPDELDVTAGIDTDDDGVPDTTVVDDGADLLVATDLDGDGIADQVLRLGGDGAVHRVEPIADTAPETPG
ncbi:DUF6802 family protein [Pseudonocardia sp. CA-107938]|uniref:DUF6802 family protein n=1 Tax=Pseudonocardia sp. CA-107938 TaxID=3240021 RepID=UPI003D8BD73E